MPAVTRRLVPAVVVAAAAFLCLSLAPTAGASYIVDRNVKDPTLKVNRAGMALVQYTRADGKRLNVFLWGAVNGIANQDLGRRQIRFKYDTTGGWDALPHETRWKP